MRGQDIDFSESTQSLLHMFKRLRDTQALHHAYCIVGPSQQTVHRVVEEIAAILLSVKKIPHTDCSIFDSEKDQSIEAVRTFIQNFQSTPLVAEYRVGILTHIQNLSVQSQNALLKTIEEPPKKGIILCTANHPRTIVPTILSRVALIRVQRPSKKELEALYKQKDIPNSLFSLQAFLDEVPSSNQNAEESNEKIRQAIDFFFRFREHPSEHITSLQTAFQEKSFDDIPMKTVAHWWIVALVSEMKQKESQSLRQRNIQLIRALHFFLNNDLAVNMPLWLQSILAQSR